MIECGKQNEQFIVVYACFLGFECFCFLFLKRNVWVNIRFESMSNFIAMQNGKNIVKKINCRRNSKVTNPMPPVKMSSRYNLLFSLNGFRILKKPKSLLVQRIEKCVCLLNMVDIKESVGSLQVFKNQISQPKIHHRMRAKWR